MGRRADGGARRGDSVTVDGDTVHSARGTQALYNVADLCRRAEPGAWAGIVGHHFNALDAATRSADSGAGSGSAVGAEDIRGSVYLRLVPDDAFPAEAASSFGYARHVATGLLEVLALDLDDVARSLTGRELPDDGALFTVPSRHFLVFHPLEDANAVGAINDLAAFGLGAHRDNPLMTILRRLNGAG
ncbi:hypothetical protein ACWGCP_34120 [Streptomyces niveus]